MTNDYFKKRRKETGTKIVKQNFSTNAANISTKSVFSSTNGFWGGMGEVKRFEKTSSIMMAF